MPGRDLRAALNRYLGGNTGAAAGQLADDFHHVTQNVSPGVLSRGLSKALGSDRTPTAGEMVSQMFEASTPEQRAAMLNQLVAALGPAGMSIVRNTLGQSAAPAGGNVQTSTPVRLPMSARNRCRMSSPRPSTTAPGSSTP